MSFSIPQHLEHWGFSPYFQQQWLSIAETRPELAEMLAARVVGVRRGEWLLSDGSAPSQRAVVAGRLGQDEDARAPSVGDFVLASQPTPDGLLRVEHLFEAKTLLSRKSAFRSSVPQVLAANVDLAIVVAALAGSEASTHVQARALNQRRIERYLVAIREACVRPLVVVNKADLLEAGLDPAAELRDELGSVDVLLVSAQSGLGMQALVAELGVGVTAVLLGSSGVGKSTLTNSLLERETQRVQAERGADGRGRHTTTERALFALPSGGFLIDTPGMREFGLAASEEGTSELSSEFEDIRKLGERCHFRDCQHESEPGCAVRAAIESGELASGRLESQKKLTRELEFQRQRQDKAAHSNARKKWRAVSQAVRERMRDKQRGD